MQSRLGLQQNAKPAGAAPCVRATPKSASRSRSARRRSSLIYGAIKTTVRGAMGHAVADKRVYCHEALHLKGKLQAAGYKQAVEKWDADSDSDSSDEEDLKM